MSDWLFMNKISIILFLNNKLFYLWFLKAKIRHAGSLEITRTVPLILRFYWKFRPFVILKVNILFILFFYFSGEVVKIEVDPLFSEQKKIKRSKLRQKGDKNYFCGKCDYVATNPVIWRRSCMTLNCVHNKNCF